MHGLIERDLSGEAHRVRGAKHLTAYIARVVWYAGTETKHISQPTREYQAAFLPR